MPLAEKTSHRRICRKATKSLLPSRHRESEEAHERLSLPGNRFARCRRRFGDVDRDDERHTNGRSSRHGFADACRRRKTVSGTIDVTSLGKGSLNGTYNVASHELELTVTDPSIPTFVFKGKIDGGRLTLTGGPNGLNLSAALTRLGGPPAPTPPIGAAKPRRAESPPNRPP